MKALITVPGNTAAVHDIPIPEPATGEIRIKVHAVALNPVDALYVAHPSDKPGRVVGSDIAGVVDKIGNGVTKWKLGDRVAGLLQGATSADYRPGGFAEHAILEEDLTIGIPSKVSFEEAATLPLCSLTAAQALFINVGINAPFDSPFKFHEPTVESPSVLLYSAATSVGMFAIELLKRARETSGRKYRIFATASPQNHAKLRTLGVEAVFDYKSPSWPEDVRELSGGISYAIDCISEDATTGLVSQTFAPGGGKIAVIRRFAWNKDSVRPDVTPVYSAVWSGLGHEIVYNGEPLPAPSNWRDFSVAFYKYLSAGSSEDSEVLSIAATPVRYMPCGLAAIVEDGFALLGSGKVSDRVKAPANTRKEWMRPISAEKLVYTLETS